MNETFGPQERIRYKKDFNYIYKHGKRYTGKYFILVYLSNGLYLSRMAVVVKKKIGNAVRRNTIKRRMRALFRTNKSLLTGSYDLIFIIRPQIRDAGWPEIKADYLRSIRDISRTGYS